MLHRTFNRALGAFGGLLTLLTLTFPFTSPTPLYSQGACTSGQFISGSLINIGQTCTTPVGNLAITTTSSSGTTYTGTTSPALTAYTSGQTLNWNVGGTQCTAGAVTISINGLGAKSIKEADGTTNPVVDDCTAGRLVQLTYDGTLFRITGGGTVTSGGGGSGTVTNITLVGTSNQITVTGTCNVTVTGTCTFSLPSALQLPGTINKLTLTQPATGATVTIVDGKTFTVNKTLTLDGTDGVTITFPASNATVATLGLTNTFTGRQDASGAASTSPMKTGTSLPGTCIVGDLFFKSNATAGQNIYQCQSTNTWTQQLNSGAGTPGGSNTQIQYNNSGAFAGITGATTNGTSVTLTTPDLGIPSAIDLTNATKVPITLTTGGSSGPSTYTQATNTLNIPQYTGGGSSSITVAPHNGSYTVLSGDVGKSLTTNVTATWVLPQATGSFTSGYTVLLSMVGTSGVLKVTTTTSVFYGGTSPVNSPTTSGTINYGSTLYIPANTTVRAISDGTNWEVISQYAPPVGWATSASTFTPLVEDQGPVPYVPTIPGANVYYASPSGSGTTCSLGSPCSLTGAQTQSRVHGSGATVLLLGGTYTLGANFVLSGPDNGISYWAYPYQIPVIDGNSAAFTIFTDNSGSHWQNGSMQGITFQNIKADGLDFSFAVSLSFRWNRFLGCTNQCIFSQDANVMTIDSNWFNDVVDAVKPAGGAMYIASGSGSGPTGPINFTHNIVRNTTGMGFTYTEQSPSTHGADNSVIDRNIFIVNTTSWNDAGAIYMYDKQNSFTSITISNNYVYANANGSLTSNLAACIYLDEGVQHVHVIGNACIANGGTYNGFIIHGGNDNLFENNYFDISNAGVSGTFMGLYQSMGTDPHGMVNNVFQNNIIYTNSTFPPAGLVHIGLNGGSVEPTFTGNCYFSVTGQPMHNNFDGFFGGPYRAYVDSAPVLNCNPMIQPVPAWFKTAYGSRSPYSVIPVITGCGTLSAQTGGALGGTFITTNSGSCTMVVPLPVSAAGNGYFCAAADQSGNAGHQSANTSTSCSVVLSTSPGDRVVWSASPF